MTKKFLALLIAANLCVGSQFAGAADPAHPDQPIVPLTEAISRLKDGNARYTNGKQQHPRQATKERAKLTKSQHPFAIVIGCADSRVPPEIVFDQGLGDLFVLRVAGNVIDNHSLGSIEYAVDHLAVRLIVVLGHQSCGAVKAAIDTIAAKSEAPAHIQSLVTAIQPAVEATVNRDLETTVKANVNDVVQAVRSSTPVLKPKVDSGELRVLGAYYSLDTGVVSFLDEK